MDVNFLIGAIIGSGVAIFAGRAPAERLVQLVQSKFGRGRGRR